MNRENYDIEDIIEMSPRERDRVAAIFMSELGRSSEGGVWPTPISEYWHGRQNEPPHDDYPMWPKYSQDWSHCGRLLEVLPIRFQYSPESFFSDEMPCEHFPRDPLSKESIVLAANICWLRGIEPRGGES